MEMQRKSSESQELASSIDGLVEQYGATNVVVAIKRSMDDRDPSRGLQDALLAVPAHEAPSFSQAIRIYDEARDLGMGIVRPDIITRRPMGEPDETSINW
jgi:hypothetical protein